MTTEVSPPEQPTDAVERLRRFAVGDEHWQLVWANSADMKEDIVAALPTPQTDIAMLVEALERIANTHGATARFCRETSRTALFAIKEPRR